MANERPRYLGCYQNQINFELEMGEGVVLRALRQGVSEQSLSATDEARLNGLDQDVISAMVLLDEIAEYLLNDDDTQPLQSWWWHLGKIRKRTYPADLLPPHLRAVYLDTEND